MQRTKRSFQTKTAIRKEVRFKFNLNYQARKHISKSRFVRIQLHLNCQIFLPECEIQYFVNVSPCVWIVSKMFGMAAGTDHLHSTL